MYNNAHRQRERELRVASRRLEAQARKEGVASFNQSTHDAFSFEDGFFKGRCVRTFMRAVLLVSFEIWLLFGCYLAI